MDYWDGNAKWHKLWLEHNEYHKIIIEILTTLVQPGWKILDIGAGSGVLSLPLCDIGCEVTALEPSAGMKNLLYEESLKRGIDIFSVDARRWEDFPDNHIQDFDLIIACNSLHLTQMNFSAALEKVFAAKPQNMFIISECCFLEIMGKKRYRDLTMVFSECFNTESSYAYHCLDDVFEHWSFRHGRFPGRFERQAALSEVIYDGHLWIKDFVTTGIHWWKRFPEGQQKGMLRPIAEGYAEQ